MRTVRKIDRPLDYSPIQPMTQPEHWTATFAGWLLAAAGIGGVFMLCVALGL